MKYLDIAMPNYNLHLIKTDKFRVITLRVVYTALISKEEVIKRNFLTDLLVQSTKKYPSKRELGLKSQDLYAVSISTHNNRLGKYYNSNFIMTALNEKYTEKGNIEECFKLLNEILYNPDVKDNKFNENSFQIVYKNIEAEIKSIKEQPKKYANAKMMEIMGKDEPYAIKTYGELAELKKLTPENMYEFYLNNLNCLKDIYILGDFDIDKMKLLVDKYFAVNKKIVLEKLFIEHKESNKLDIYKEQDNNNQSKLAIGCKIYDLTYKEREYVLPLYNMILGGGADSKFFRNIREKHSLCYYINSRCNKVDNIMAITSGISLENYDKVFSLIKKEMNNMLVGEITNEELNNAKNIFMSLLDEIFDAPQSIIEAHYATVLLDSQDIETRKKELNNVTKEDIMKVSAKIKIDTVFLLEGISNEKD
ncbi:MAG: pitrilysin family protein [Bacilli bacterium]